MGQKGPNGQLPVITNTTALQQGVGIVLARDNQLKKLHIRDTRFTAIAGAPQLQAFGGDIDIQSVLVTGANQSGALIPGGGPGPSVFLAPVVDSNMTIKNSEIGSANVTSIAIYQFGGHGIVRISNSTVRDQAQLSEDFEVSPGIAVIALGSSSLDVAVVDTTVSNIGSAFLSNSDGLLLLNQGSGAMKVKVDGYHYSNPDGGGFGGTSTGIEMGFWGSTGGGIFDGVVSNSVIEDAFYTGIQILDQLSGGSNTLTANIRDNTISGTWDGVQAFTDSTPNSNFAVNITGNTISPGNRFDCNCSDGIFVSAGRGQTNIFDVRIEKNTVLDAPGNGLFFILRGSVNSLQVDAGLGGLGSSGHNRIIGSVVADIATIGMPVTAANNWWGSASGPANVAELNGGTVDVEPFLTKDPK